jgi:xylan 1,4-beta-xylosidase
LRVQLDNLPAGNYRLGIYAIGYGKNDAYTAYLHMGAPHQITRTQVAALNAASNGEPESTVEIQVCDGRFSHDLPLRTNDVYLLVLTPSQGPEKAPQ